VSREILLTTEIWCHCWYYVNSAESVSGEW